jgi:hypothetical protein
MTKQSRPGIYSDLVCASGYERALDEIDRLTRERDGLRAALERAAGIIWNCRKLKLAGLERSFVYEAKRMYEALGNVPDEVMVATLDDEDPRYAVLEARVSQQVEPAGEQLIATAQRRIAEYMALDVRNGKLTVEQLEQGYCWPLNPPPESRS